jgi:hypothetical protein
LGGPPGAAPHAGLFPGTNGQARGDPTDRQLANCPRGMTALDRAEQRLTWLANVLKLGACKVIKVYLRGDPSITPPHTPTPVSNTSHARAMVGDLL